MKMSHSNQSPSLIIRWLWFAVCFPFFPCPGGGHRLKAVVFLVVMYICESWTIKKAEHWRIDAFELWCWRRLLRVPYTVRRANQSILKDINSKYSLEGLIQKLKPAKNQLIRKDPNAGKVWRQKKGMAEDEIGKIASLTGWTWVWASSENWWWTGKPDVLQSMGSERVWHDWATELIFLWQTI